MKDDARTATGDPQALKSEFRDGMLIDWDVPIEMDDGIVLRCDAYRPTEAGKYPVLSRHGCRSRWFVWRQRPIALTRRSSLNLR